MQKIAIVWTGHIRTFYRTIDGFEKNVIEPNSDRFEFEHAAHFYPILTAEISSGYSMLPPYASAYNMECYFKATKNRLNITDERMFFVSDTMSEDRKMIDEIPEERRSTKVGLFYGITYSFVKRSRAWIDIFESNDDIRERYAAFVFARPDVGFCEKMKFPVDWNPSSFDAPAIFGRKDVRVNGKCEDDRWFVVPAHARNLMLNLGSAMCKCRADRTDHMMAEEGLWNAFELFNVKRVYTHPNGYKHPQKGFPIVVHRFGRNDQGPGKFNEIELYNNFIKLHGDKRE